MSFSVSLTPRPRGSNAPASRLSRFVAATLVLAGALASTPVAAADLATATPFGSQSFVAAADWRPVDFHMFSSLRDSSDMVLALPEPNHKLHPELFIGPGAAHASPYNTELGSGLAAAGFVEKTVFGANEFDGTLGNGVFLAFMVIADPVNAPSGLTPDGITPMIPNSIFPMTLSYSISQDGVAFDVAGPFDFILALDGNRDPPFAVDGHSHFPVFLEEDSTFLQAPARLTLPGHYDFYFELADTRGNGYVITSAFDVTPVPEPSTALLLVVGALALAGRARWAKLRSTT